jgi:hypothetical protein
MTSIPPEVSTRELVLVMQKRIDYKFSLERQLSATMPMLPASNEIVPIKNI